MDPKGQIHMVGPLISRVPVLRSPDDLQTAMFRWCVILEERCQKVGIRLAGLRSVSVKGLLVPLFLSFESPDTGKAGAVPEAARHGPIHSPAGAAGRLLLASREEPVAAYPTCWRNLRRDSNLPQLHGERPEQLRSIRQPA